MIRRLSADAKGKVSVYRLLTKVANHEAVVRMLAQSFPGATEDEIRRSLTSAATLLHALKEWEQGAKDKSTSPTSSTKNPARQAPAPAGSPTALEGVAKVKVFIDGASKGNPGPAAIGIVFSTLDGRTLFEEAQCIGETTNGVAEYTALVTALKILLESGGREAYFFSDSEFMVRQMTGVYKVKTPAIMPLAKEAQALRRRLGRFQITHVPRGQNRRADQLAGLALKQAADAAVM